jgi:hypothetical protein
MGERFVRGHIVNVWKVGDQYFAQSVSARENPDTTTILLGIGGLAALGIAVYFVMKSSTTPAPATTPAIGQAASSV